LADIFDGIRESGTSREAAHYTDKPERHQSPQGGTASQQAS